MESLSFFAKGFVNAVTPENLLFCLLGSFMGTLIGVLPGIGPTAGIALLLPLVIGLPPIAGIITLSAIYYGSMYGGSTTAILINMPGEAASAITAVDGYPMARKGLAGPALVMAAVGSFVAGTIGLFGLSIASPILANFALHFGPPEYMALILFALTIVINLFGKSVVKGAIAATLGFLLAIPGLDPTYGLPRYTFKLSFLYNGVDLVSAVVGLFAIAEVLKSAEESIYVICEKIGRFFPDRNEIRACIGPILRSTGIGFFLGLIPGCTPAVASFMAYDVEKRFSKHPERFGTGVIEGVAAPETANNAITSSGFIPLFSLGIPQSPPLAILLGALILYGVIPGPLLFEQKPDFVWTVIASMYIGNVMLLVLNVPLVGFWVKFAQIPYRFMGPVVLVFCFIGTYSVRSSMFDVWVAVFFGLLGYTMNKVDIPSTPLIITLILVPLLETSFAQTYSISDGVVFNLLLHRPIAMTLIAGAVFITVISIFQRYRLNKILQLQKEE